MEQVLALGKEESLDVNCAYAGLSSDVQSPLIRESELKFDRYEVSSGKLNRYLTWKHVKEFSKFVKGLGEAGKLVRTMRPDYIFAAGGHVAVPVSIMATALRIPLVTHETDVIPGLANKMTARYARRIFTAYPVDSYKNLPKAKLQQVGQPVRAEFYADHRHENIELDGRTVKTPLLTVTGGSQGGHRLNVHIQNSWETLLEKMNIVHITGQRDYAEFSHAASELPVHVREKLWIAPFVSDELPALFQQSDVVVSRAGGTIAELAAVRAAVILVPLSTSAQNHQQANAAVFEKAGAVQVFDEVSGTSVELAHQIMYILENQTAQAALRDAIGQFDFPNAAREMAKFMLSGSIPT